MGSEGRLGIDPVDQFRPERAEPMGAARIDPVYQFRLGGVEALGAACVGRGGKRLLPVIR